jgi:hypothetical protein
MDIYLENIVKKKKDKKDILKIVGIILAGFIVSDLVILLSFLISFLRAISVILFAGVWFGVYWLISSWNLEFEYSVTNGEIDVDSIISRRKRKRLLSVRVRDIACCASVYDKEYADEYKNKEYTASVVMAASAIDAPGTYFADLVTREGLKTRLFFEPTPQMLEAFTKYNPRNIHILND